MAVDKVRAKELREQGLTFREMASELDCSEVYLRTLMKGVVKGVRYQELSVEDDLKRISKELAGVVKRLEATQED